MDAILHKQFERVEAALGTLVDSIASFNPSPQAAVDLVAADDELSEGLEQLTKHQANHASIVALRAEAEALEAQLKTSMSTLASLRQELFETPTTTFSDDSRPVPFNELLQYAKTISSYTVPPTYREHIPKGNGEEDKDKDKDDATSVGLPSAGLNTPAIANAPSHLDEPMKDAPEGEDPDADKKEVTAEQAQWLTKMKENGWSWVPWPDDNKIRSGNLMQIQRLLDQDKDPWKERVPTPQELETQARDEQQQQQAVEKARPVQEPPMPIRRESILVSPTAPSQPAQFMGFDFDEEE